MFISVSIHTYIYTYIYTYIHIINAVAKRTDPAATSCGKSEYAGDAPGIYIYDMYIGIHIGVNIIY